MSKSCLPQRLKHSFMLLESPTKAIIMQTSSGNISVKVFTNDPDNSKILFSDNEGSILH